MSDLVIRKAEERDRPAIWAIWRPIVQKGDTYTFDPATPEQEALALWIDRPTVCYVAEADGRLIGTYYIKPNQAGPGSHVCNAGFMVDASHGARGVGRVMGEHALPAAKALGFRAMQFNMVVSTNEHAVRLWQSLGFDIVGRLPQVFRHPEAGFVDAFVMYRML